MNFKIITIFCVICVILSSISFGYCIFLVGYNDTAFNIILSSVSGFYFISFGILFIELNNKRRYHDKSLQNYNVDNIYYQEPSAPCII